MSESIQSILSSIERDKKLLGITLYEKASIADITSFEKKKGLDLPDDLRTFYSYCNGFESEEDLFRIIPLKEILENKRDNFIISPEDFHIAASQFFIKNVY
jgi:cell wall assembly regulator SMI1